MEDTTYLAASEVAERLGISLRTVRRRIADGSLPSVKIGGAVRVPVSALEPPPARPRVGAREVAVAYGSETDEEYVRRWNRDHWPDSWERMLARRREAFAELAEARQRTKPPSGPHDTVDAMLNEVRDEFGARLLPYLPPPPNGDT
jgi:excisionase family DNA binding protein